MSEKSSLELAITVLASGTAAYFLGQFAPAEWLRGSLTICEQKSENRYLPLARGSGTFKVGFFPVNPKEGDIYLGVSAAEFNGNSDIAYEVCEGATGSDCTGSNWVEYKIGKNSEVKRGTVKTFKIEKNVVLTGIPLKPKDASNNPGATWVGHGIMISVLKEGVFGGFPILREGCKFPL